MRKFVLIAAMVLASATAHAESRSLSLAGSNVPVVTEQPKAVAEQPKAVAQKAAEAPVYVERPAVVEPKTEPPKAAEPPKAETAKVEQDKPVATKTASAPKAGKPKRKRYWTEARIIHELHRHGIYW